MKEKIYIFDLDHTLINAKLLREDLGLILKGDRSIISEEIWDAFSKKKPKILDFLNSDLKKYFFTDVFDFLLKIRDKKILLSFGHIEYQKSKIKSLGLYEVFNEVILTDKNKLNWLIEFVEKNKEKEIIFINDNYNKRFNENKEIKEKISNIKIIEVDNYNRKNDILNILNNLVFKK